jgi:hypothetical protein
VTWRHKNWQLLFPDCSRLKLNFKIFFQVYSEKKRVAEQQLELAKELCDKLKKKRLSLVGAFVSTHSGSIEDVDRLGAWGSSEKV